VEMPNAAMVVVVVVAAGEVGDKVWQKAQA